MGEIARAVQQVAQVNDADKAFSKLINRQLPAMRRILNNEAAVERLGQIAMECYRKNPDLGKCTPESIRECLLRCASLGLEPSDVDGMGNVYLIRYGSRCTVQLGYRGMLVLMRRSGLYDSIVARAVHKGDTFECSFGTEESIKHIPCENPGELTHVYLVAYTKGSNRPYINVLNRAQIEERREASKKGNSGPWVTHYEAMAIKSVIRDSFKVLPKSTEMQSAIDSEGPASDGPAGETPAVDVPVEYVVPEEVEG